MEEDENEKTEEEEEEKDRDEGESSPVECFESPLQTEKGRKGIKQFVHQPASN
jgi:hypothetical protein